jgi:hypothetical protein
VSTDCLNLAELFGGRFVVRFDPAYEFQEGSEDRAWAMMLRSRFGVIFPFGGHRLAVEVEGRPSIRKRLDSLKCCKRYIAGERFGCWLFHVRDFERVAAVVKPARKRAWTGTERHRSRNQLEANRNAPQNPRTDSRISSAVCEAEPLDGSEAVSAGNRRFGAPKPRT